MISRRKRRRDTSPRRADTSRTSPTDQRQGPIANAGPSDRQHVHTADQQPTFLPGSTACAGSPNPGCQAGAVDLLEHPGGGSAPGRVYAYWSSATTRIARCQLDQRPVLGISCCKNSTTPCRCPSSPITQHGQLEVNRNRPLDGRQHLYV